MTSSNNKKLMTPRQRTAINKVANSNHTPHNARAKALLAVDDGVTQSVAAEQNGLTRDIVKYWLMKFRKSGISIFPLESKADDHVKSIKTNMKSTEDVKVLEEKVQPKPTLQVNIEPLKKKAKKKKKDKKLKDKRKEVSSEKIKVVKKKKDKKKEKKKNSSETKGKKKGSKSDKKKTNDKKQKDKKSKKKKDKKKK